MILRIRYYGDKILREKAKPIEVITEEIRTLARDMIETMDKSNGIGLAAPQVGHSIRLFVVRNYIEAPNAQLTLSAPHVYINPKLSNPSLKKVEDTEGCLSIPGIRGEVERPLKITIEALDLNGNPFIEHLEGINARVRMHENDHLNGVLFIDRVSLRQKKKMEPHLKLIEEKYKTD
jgi:peptide deformylase